MCSIRRSPGRRLGALALALALALTLAVRGVRRLQHKRCCITNVVHWTKHVGNVGEIVR